MSRFNLKEPWKTPIDQTLHALWGGVPWWLAAVMWPFTPVAIVSTLIFVRREIEQWPSSRPWDPWLDAACFVLGSGVGIWLGLR